MASISMSPQPQTTQTHRLPPEILALVFEVLRDVYPINVKPDDDIGYEIFYLYCWLNVTRVCSYWRRVAIHHTVLWTSFNSGLFARPRLCELFLERSRPDIASDHDNHDNRAYEINPPQVTVPLSIKTGETPTESSMHVLMYEIHRIRTLALEFTREHALINTARDLQNRVPIRQLQDVNLNMVDGNESTAIVCWHIVQRLLSSASTLRSLRFRWTWFSWDGLGTLSGLRSLSVFSCRLVTHASLADAVDTLRRLPALEELDLGYSIQSEKPYIHRIHPTIHLPRLRKLRLYEGIHGLRLWSLIEPHPDNSTYVQADVSSVEEAIQAAAPALARYQAAPGNQSYPLSLTVSSGHYLAFQLASLAMDNDRDEPTRTMRRQPELELLLRVATERAYNPGAEDPNREALRSAFTDALPLHRVARLIIPIDDINGRYTEYIPSLTARLTALESIDAEGLRPAGLENLARAISQWQDGISNMLDIPVPALQKLAFRGCRFDEDTFTTLLDALITRAQAGVRLGEMTVEYSVFEQDWVVRLQSAVDIRLPPEILAFIFELWRAISPVTGDPSHSGSNQVFKNTWLAVIHVCPYWRTTAILHTVLWTTITRDILARAELCNLFLQYSGAALLDVDAGLAQDLPMFIHILSHEMHRIRRLKTRIDPYRQGRVAPSMTVVNTLGDIAPVPQMQHFELAQEYRPLETPGAPNDLLSFRIPSRTMNHILSSMATLHGLHLCRTSFSWRDIADTLRELTLDSVTAHATFRDVLEGLRRMRFLEKLELLHVIPPEDEGHPESYPIVHLPHLRDLHLDDDGYVGTQCLRLWSHIEAHPDNYTRIVASCNTAEDILRAAEPALSRYQAAALGHLSCGLYLRVAYEIEIKFQFAPLGTNQNILLQQSPESHPGLDLSLLEEFESTMTLPGSGHRTLWSGLALALPLHNVAHLHVPYDDIDGTETNEINTLTERTTALERLSVEHLHPKGFQNISRALCKPVQGSEGRIPMPALRRLDFQFCKFDDHSVHTLLYALRTRALAGFRLSEMMVGFSAFGEEWLELFEEIVGVVGWDYDPVVPG
ncbi:hypothetical protein PENSPDRAFT_679722 [Peniophora sp. CONT]|nr:hypothetical protein PENSPDRAFT_679722 [Peniophora sp. CONT]